MLLVVQECRLGLLDGRYSRELQKSIQDNTSLRASAGERILGRTAQKKTKSAGTIFVWLSALKMKVYTANHPDPCHIFINSHIRESQDYAYPSDFEYSSHLSSGHPPVLSSLKIRRGASQRRPDAPWPGHGPAPAAALERADTSEGTGILRLGFPCGSVRHAP